MSRPIRILDIASSDTARQRIERLLDEAGIALELIHVDSLAALRDALGGQAWDAAVCCHPASDLDTEAALRLVKESAVPWFAGDDPEALASGMISLGGNSPRSRAAQELLASETRFREYIHNANIGIFVADGDGRYFDCNSAAAKMLGYEVPELLQMSIGECVPPEDLARSMESLHSLATQGWLTDEFRLLRKDGVIIWISLLAVALPGGLGIAYCQDITERKRTEAALRESEEQFRTLFQNSPFPALEVDASGLLELLPEVTESGPELAESLTNSPERSQRLASRIQIHDRNAPARALLGNGGEMRQVPACAIAALTDACRKLNCGQGRTEFECGFCGVDGVERSVFASASVAPGHEATLKRVFVTFVDITERKRAEQELREREAKYRAVIETSADGFWLLDRQGRILETNDAYLRSSGYTREEVVGRKIWDFAVEGEAAVLARIAHIVEHGSALFETWHRAKDGSEWQVEINSTYCQIADGRLFTFVRDLYRRKRAEALRRARIRLSEIADHGTAEEVMQAALDEVEVLVGGEYGLFHILDAEAGTVEPAAWSTRTRKKLGEPAAARYPLAQAGPWAQAAAEQEPQTWQGDPRRAGWGLGERDPEISSELAFPVCRQGKVGAVLVVAGKNGAYDAADIEAAGEIASIAMNLVERKRAEERQRLSDERLHLALVASRMGVWEWDFQSGTLFRSDECDTMVDLRGLGRAITEFGRLIEPEDWRRAEDEAKQAVAERRHLSTEFRLHSPQGGTRWLSVFAQPRYDAAGKPIALVGTVADVTERKRAEQNLRVSEERLRLLVETNFDWIWEIDAQGRYVYVSPRCRDLLGYEPAEVLGKTPFDFMPEVEAARLRPLVEQVIRTRQPFVALENANRHKDGHLVILETSGLPLIGPDGELRGYCGVDRDVTGRKIAERRGGTREAVSRALAESPAIDDAAPRILVAIGERWDWDAGGLWLAQPTQSVTPVAFWRREQRSRGTGAEPRCEPLPTPDSCLLQEIQDSGLPRIAPTGPHRQDCPEAAAEAASGFAMTAIVPLRADARTIGFIQLWTRRTRDPHPRESELLAALGEQIGEFIERRSAQQSVQRFVAYGPAVLYALRIDSDRFRFTWTSDNVTHLTGYRPEETDAAWWIDHIHPEDRDRVLAAHTLPYEVEHQILEFRLRRKDGTYFWLRDEKRLVRDAAGQPSEVIGTWVDITERMLLEQQLRQSQKMEAVGSLAGGVAHDFNNLLTVINGYSQLMLATVAPADPLRSSVEEIHKAGERAATLTRQLLAFSRKQVLEPQHLSLNRVITDLQSMLGRVVGEHIKLNIVANAANDAIWADCHQLEQVVMNLVLNARDAMPRGGSLTLETSEAEIAPSSSGLAEGRMGSYVVLTVTDTGVGMDQEMQNRIFEPFFTTKAPDRGTGLGLSTVQGIVVQSGGFIEVSSSLGAGSSFRVYLPATDRRAPAPVPVASKPVAAVSGSGTILVLEDQPEVREYAALSLRTLGYQVLTASNAEEAIRICERAGTAIELLITDVVMPDMSGPDMAQRLLALQPGLKVLYMSGHAGEMVSNYGLDAGGVFLQKPFRPQDLGEKVRELLQARDRARRILIADDEPGVRKFLRIVLEKGGYEVVEAVDGMQALKEARRSAVDLLLTDLVMPEQEGIETIRMLRKEKPSIRIIAISGKFDKPYLKMAETLGADAVMPKPISAQALLARVADLLTRPARSAPPAAV